MFTYAASNWWWEETSPLKLLEAVKKIGFSAIEVLDWTDYNLEELAEASQKTGVKFSAILASSKDPERAKLLDNRKGIVCWEVKSEYVQAMQETIDAAKVLGINIIVTTTGNTLPNYPRTAQKDCIVQALSSVAPLLEKANMTAVLEPLNTTDHPGYFLQRTEEAADIINRVKSSHVKILYDVYHQQISEGNLISTIQKYAPMIGHYHIADVPGRNQPGTGEINYKNVLKAIRETGYSGYVTFECAATEPLEIVSQKMWDLLKD